MSSYDVVLKAIWAKLCDHAVLALTAAIVGGMAVALWLLGLK